MPSAPESCIETGDVMNNFRFTTYAQRPELLAGARRLNGSVWPEFMFHDAVADRLWDRPLQGQGLSRMVLRGMRHRAAQAGLTALIAPVRPTLKGQYPFPESGQYIVPGALNPIEIDCEADRGRYIEPNVWMQHQVAERERLD